jgi:trk system potassium uptake protein TrkH
LNLQRVFHLLGLVLYVLAAAQLVPIVWCFLPGDWLAARGFLVGAASAALIGLAFRQLGSRAGELYRREGVLVVVGSWLLASIAGAVPYLASGAVASPVDALFESASGFTTTGASILIDIEALPRPVLFWRSMTQWLGGIGIVVLFVALLSELGPGARFLFKLEVPGPKAEILHARVRQTAVALFRVYLALTAAQVCLLLLVGVGFYDAVVHTFSTVSTGGFSPYADSLAHFPAAAQMVVLVFMLAAGINFSLYYALASRRDLVVFRDVEARVYLLVGLAASALVAVDLFGPNGPEINSRGQVFLDSVFQVVSILTTTGFATADFDEWPAFARAMLVGLMLVGGCAGSTAGGVKVIRLLLGWRAAMREVRLTFSPNSVVAVTVGGKPIPEESVRGVVALLLLWALAWGVGAVLLAVGDTEVVTAATASIATLSNIGPGLSAVGPTGNFAFFAPWQKLVMVLLMLLGRLEFFAVLALLQRQFWRR